MPSPSDPSDELEELCEVSSSSSLATNALSSSNCRVTDLLYLRYVIGHRQILMSDIVEFLSELQLPGYCACDEDLLHVRPSILWRLGIPGIAK